MVYLGFAVISNNCLKLPPNRVPPSASNTYNLRVISLDSCQASLETQLQYWEGTANSSCIGYAVYAHLLRPKQLHRKGRYPSDRLHSLWPYEPPTKKPIDSYLWNPAIAGYCNSKQDRVLDKKPYGNTIHRSIPHWTPRSRIHIPSPCRQPII